jgi:Ca2+-binding RTX toxin-like protein
MATLEGTGGANSLVGLDTENDSIWGAGGADILRGGPALGTGGGNDFLDGGTGDDVIFGGDGDDTLISGSGGGDDLLDGGAGTDTADYSRNLTDLIPGAVFAANNTDVIVNLTTGIASGLGDDTLVGIENVITGGGDDSITGNTAANLLIAGSGADTIFGGLGNDTLDGGAGNDILSGDGGTDTASYATQTGAITANLTTGLASGAAGNDTLSGIENLTGGSGADSLTGSAGANTLDGGLGNDTLDGAGGADSLVGGGGIDTASYASQTGAVTANLTTGLASGAAGADTLSGIENLIGGSGNDSLTGDGQANQLIGNGGADTLIGNAGADTLGGGAGNDSIDGGADADIIAGGSGNDTIDGGTGDDAIAAGPSTPTGADLFLDWDAQGASGSSIEAGFTQNVGGQVNVQVSYTESSAGSSFSIDDGPAGGDAVPIYAPVNELPGGREFDPNSAAVLLRPGGPNSSVVTMNFSGVAGAGTADQVEDVYFRISDIDIGGFRDQVTILAFDENGNQIPVTITASGQGLLDLTINGNVVTANTGINNTSPSGEDGSVLIYIPGPVASIQISYTDLNNPGSTQGVLISDVHFSTIPADNDVVAGGDGNDTISGGYGDDSLLGQLGNDSLLGEAGNDTLDGGVGEDTLFGGDGSDSILGDTGNDVLYGGAGNDTVLGGADSDTLYGGAGNDALSGELGGDLLLGEDGNDTLTGNAGNDTLTGGIGTDLVFGGADRDAISMLFADALGTESVDGGSAGTDNDTLTVDITGFGWTRIDVVYDPLNNENGTITFFAPDGITVIGTLTFTEIENLVIVCFTTGTQIMTERGEVAVEALQPGDRVLTRDNGMQPLRWIGTRQVSHRELQAMPDLQPVRIGSGALGGQLPKRSMLVSPQHRVLIEGAKAEMYFGESEVLVAAKHLVGQAEVTRALPAEGVSYVHILFDRHEIVLSDGIWTESFQPAERTLSSLDGAARTEVLELFPELDQGAGAFAAARPSLKAHEAKVLVSG